MTRASLHSYVKYSLCGLDWTAVRHSHHSTIFMSFQSQINSQETNASSASRKTMLGSPDNFWLWSPEEGFDLSRPPNPDSSPVSSSLRLECQVSNTTIDPAKTALLIIDVQNFTLGAALRNDLSPEMFEAEQAILKYGIPAARRAGIQIVWLNWGLTDEDLRTLPPQQFRVFGWTCNIQKG